MKTVIFMIGLIAIVVLLTGCGLPETPNEVLPYCQEQYQAALASYPDLPPAYIGACVSLLQTGKPNAYISLCGSESFWNWVYDQSEGAVYFDSKSMCRDYFKNYEE